MVSSTDPQHFPLGVKSKTNFCFLFVAQSCCMAVKMSSFRFCTNNTFITKTEHSLNQRDFDNSSLLITLLKTTTTTKRTVFIFLDASSKLQ